MKQLSRGAWIAIAAAIAIPGTFAIAKSYERSGWSRMSPETKQRLDEGKLAMAKTALKLTPDQEKLWTPVEEQVRSAFKDREAKRAEMDKKREERRAEREARKAEGGDKGADGPRADSKRGDLAERFETMSVEMSKRADRMKAFSGAFKPFYASLSDEQKDVLRPLIRDLAPGFGGPRGGHGSRWADRGPGGKGHHGWGGGQRGERGGPDGSDNPQIKEGQADEAPDAPEAPGDAK